MSVGHAHGPAIAREEENVAHRCDYEQHEHECRPNKLIAVEGFRRKRFSSKELNDKHEDKSAVQHGEGQKIHNRKTHGKKSEETEYGDKPCQTIGFYLFRGGRSDNVSDPRRTRDGLEHVYTAEEKPDTFDGERKSRDRLIDPHQESLRQRPRLVGACNADETIPASSRDFATMVVETVVASRVSVRLTGPFAFLKPP